MKKFLYGIILFFLIILLLDFSAGVIFKRLESKGYDDDKRDYIAEKCDADILILGSSKAAEHYVSNIITDSLQMSCYNCGWPGNGVLGAYAFLMMNYERYLPKLVIYEVTPEYDYYKKDTPDRYLGLFRHLYRHDVVRELYDTFLPDDIKIKYYSNMYLYSNHLGVLKNMFSTGSSAIETMGYQPLYGKVNVSDLKSEGNHTEYQFDSLKYRYLEQLVIESKNRGVQLLFVVSPRLVLDSEEYYFAAKNICTKYDVPYFDNRILNGISDNPGLYQDLMHLNNDGAVLYTQEFIKQIKTTQLYD